VDKCHNFNKLTDLLPEGKREVKGKEGSGPDGSNGGFWPFPGRISFKL
jgi:hypothetical protein